MATSVDIFPVIGIIRTREQIGSRLETASNDYLTPLQTHMEEEFDGRLRPERNADSYALREV